MLEEGARYLRIVGLNYVPAGADVHHHRRHAGRGRHRAVDDHQLLHVWLVRLPVGWLLSSRLDWGPTGVWWAIVASTTLGLVLNYLYYRTGNWKRRVLTRPQQS